MAGGSNPSLPRVAERADYLLVKAVNSGRPSEWFLQKNKKKGTMKYIDMSGKRYGLLRVLKRGSNYSGGSLRWHVVCDCGTKKLMHGCYVRNSKNPSCGCRLGSTLIHGHCRNGKWSPQYSLYMHAKQRAKKAGIKLNITFADIHIPLFCPLLGIRLKPCIGQGPDDASPTLDRLRPHLGYTKGNVWVISNRANRAKSNLSLSELELLVKSLRKVFRSKA